MRKVNYTKYALELHKHFSLFTSRKTKKCSSILAAGEVASFFFFLQKKRKRYNGTREDISKRSKLVLLLVLKQLD